jgi:MYXO-CTERM domain-containing protein
MRLRSAPAAVLIAAASLSFVSAAHAASSNEDNTSSGNATLHWETRQSIVGPTSGKLGGSSTLQVQVSANLDPVADPSKPLLAVDMPKGVVVGASWNDDKTIELSVVDDGSKDATFTAEHTIAPHVTVFINAFGFSLTYDYAAGALLNAIPGSAWNYDAFGSTTFAPWGWTGVPLQVAAPALADAQLFSIPFPTISGKQPLGGQLAINATTKPTFIYVTDDVTLAGGTPITAKNGTWRVPTVDTDFIDVPAIVNGEITYSGDLLVRPSVEITSIGDFEFPFTLTLDFPQAGVNLPYDNAAAPIAVEFPATTFHIPLPNVKLAQKSLDLGSVTIGQEASKKAEIDNTGERAAAFTFTSSDPQFTVIGSKQGATPKSKYDLDVKFVPTAEGAQSADIKVASNDPNEPVQTIHVTGTGVKEAEPTPPAPPEEEEPVGEPPVEETGPQGDSGCGCHTAAPSPSDFGAFAVAALGLAAMLRRRRSPRA